MRVLILLRDGLPNGITTYNRTLSQALKAHGHDVITVPALEPGWTGSPWQLGLRYPLLEPLMRGAVRRLAPDLIYVSHFTQAKLAHRLQQTLGVPWVACMHNGHGEARMREWSRLLASASGLVTMCESLHRLYTPLAPVRAVPFPMLMSRLPLALPPKRGVRDVKSGSLTITYCARLSSQKGPRCEAWLRAAALLPHARAHRWMVIGGGRHLPNLRRLASELGLTVEFVGMVADPDPYLRRTDVIVGAGYALMEGVSRGAVGVGLGFGGCWGTITPANYQQAQAVNFGDHSPVPLPEDPNTIARELESALAMVDTPDADAVSKLCRESVDPSPIAADLVRFWQRALTPD